MSRFESLRCYATHRFMGRARFVELLLTGSNYIYIYIYNIIYKGHASRSCSTTRSTTPTITSRSPTSSGQSLSPTLPPPSHHPSHPRSHPPSRPPARRRLKQHPGSAVKSLKPTGIIGVSAQVGALAEPASAALAPGASAAAAGRPIRVADEDERPPPERDGPDGRLG